MSQMIPYRGDDPLREMERMLETMRNFVRLGPAADWYTQPGVTQLPINLIEEEGAVVVEAALPGVSEDDVSINLNDDILTISAEKREQSEGERGRWHVREFQYGRASRSIRLPQAVNPDKAEAELHHGVLTIRIPVEQASHRQIEIKPRKTAEGRTE